MSANSSRRSFLTNSVLAGAACMLSSPALASSALSSVIIVGAGAFGGWSALQLAQRGMRVTLVDAWGPGNSRASSGGETRTIRATYGPAHTLYVKMVARALQLWQEYQQRWNLKLFYRSGALRMAGTDDSYETAALPVLKEAGIRFEKLSAAECARRWPQVNFDGSVLECFRARFWLPRRASRMRGRSGCTPQRRGPIPPSSGDAGTNQGAPDGWDQN